MQEKNNTDVKSPHDRPHCHCGLTFKAVARAAEAEAAMTTVVLAPEQWVPGAAAVPHSFKMWQMQIGWEKSMWLTCSNQLSPEQMEVPIKYNWLPHEGINVLWMPSEAAANWQQHRSSPPKLFYTIFCSRYSIWLDIWHNRDVPVNYWEGDITTHCEMFLDFLFVFVMLCPRNLEVFKWQKRETIKLILNI